ncbi:mechanosensitive ion channel domain-containing protein [Teredinibacter franksiae]|uniref:mechanosensitive ion channel domain-containing protein n=1 Tax=Teredinibacter franksiae TaxID=2761453 RepID=UPI001627F714|nr:mechanosensitive ion channel domain-containing protein [Teredinibacter franksiae]
MNNTKKQSIYLVASRVFSLFFLLLTTALGNAQMSNPNSATLQEIKLDTATVEAKLSEVSSLTTLDDDNKAKLIDTYKKVLLNLQTAEAYKRRYAAYLQSRQSARDKAKTVRQSLKNKVRKTKPVNAREVEKLDLPALEQRYLTEKANHAAVRAKLEEITKTLSFEANRPSKIREKLLQISTRQADLANQYQRPYDPDSSAGSQEARNWLLASEYLAIKAEVLMLDQELLSQPMRLELIQANNDSTTFDMQTLASMVNSLEEFLYQRRSAFAETELKEVENSLDAYSNSHAVVQALAQKNAALGELTSTIVEDIRQTGEQAEKIRDENLHLEESMKRTKRRVSIAGFSQNLGNTLLQQSQQLQNRGDYTSILNSFNDRIASAMLDQILHEEELRNIESGEQYIQSLTVNLKLDADMRAEIQPQMEALVARRTSLLNYALELDRSYIRSLNELASHYEKIVLTVSEFQLFLNERMIWVKSSTPLGGDFLTRLTADTISVVSHIFSTGSLQQLKDNLLGSFRFLISLMAVVLVYYFRPRLYRLIENQGRNVSKYKRDTILATLKAIGFSLVNIVSIPFLLAVVSLEMLTANQTSLAYSAFWHSILITCNILFFARLVTEQTRPRGIAEIHFQRTASILTVVRRPAFKVSLFCVVILYFFAEYLRSNSDSMKNSFILLTYSAILFLTSFLMFRVFQAKDKVANKVIVYAKYLLPSIPIVLVIYTGFGYINGSITLLQKVIHTACFAYVILLLHQLVFRWLRINHRRLAFAAALERRKEFQAKARDENTHESKSASEFHDIEEVPEVDLAAINEDSKQILNISVIALAVWGVATIWSDILPAFNVLEGITLWENFSSTGGKDVITPISLADLIYSLMVIFITSISIKRLPGLLEIIVLQRLDISAGSRFTIKTLTSYILIVGTVIFVSNILGISWNKVQWLVAALSVGIGFGLQEIIANFICGLIILFERPIRIGDVVTIGDTEGVITRIQTRATTIRTWERKELLVPNKEFITGRLLNWSLSDDLTRIKIPIGIAYGSNVELAMDIVGECARNNPTILGEPAPYVSFEEFADSSLVLYLRCYIEYNDNRISTITELHKDINTRFAQNSITIAFPQTDVHLDTNGPLEVNIVSTQS